jgi:predicted PurR-regulated permease PerM
MNRDSTPPPTHDGSAEELIRKQRSALGWCALASVALVWWIVRSVALGILLGTLAAFILQPLFERAKPRVGARWAAVLTVLATMLTALGVVLFDNFALGATTRRLTVLVGTMTKRFGLGPEELEAS